MAKNPKKAKKLKKATNPGTLKNLEIPKKIKNKPKPPKNPENVKKRNVFPLTQKIPKKYPQKPKNPKTRENQ